MKLWSENGGQRAGINPSAWSLSLRNGSRLPKYSATRLTHVKCRISKEGKLLRIRNGEESMGHGPFRLEGRVRARPRDAEAIAAGTPMDGTIFAHPKFNQRFLPHRGQRLATGPVASPAVRKSTVTATSD